MTPMLRQYSEIKSQVKDTILFYRLGDFYEMFYDDAILASKELEITLTQRDAGGGNKAPMCGVPYHSYESYLEKLVSKGYKVAICEQVEDPKLAKGIVKREIVRIVSPGTIIDNKSDEKTHNYFLTLIIEGNSFSVASIDISTGELNLCEDEYSEQNSNILNELSIYNPSEILINEEGYRNKDFQKYIREFSPMINIIKDKKVDYKIIDEYFSIGEQSNLEGKTLAREALSNALSYLKNTSLMKTNHINSINFYERKNYMEIDYRTHANLEVTESLYYKTKKGSLLSIIDKTKTAMGGRMLRNFLSRPSINKEEIECRLDVVEYFMNDTILREEVRELLSEVYDLEKIISKLSQNLANARELSSLGYSLSKLPFIYDAIPKELSIIWVFNNWDDLSDISYEINRILVDEPPIAITEGGLIKEGYSQELDELRDLLRHGKERLLDLENKEREETGIKNLKIGYNRVFGYYFEVTKSNLSNVPEYFIRKQTLVNSERFFTSELKELEDKILNAGEKSSILEYEIFNNLREEIKTHISRIQRTCNIVSTLDVLLSFSQVAFENNYHRPSLNTEGRLEIIEGRHAVVEKHLESENFIANDTKLMRGQKTMQLITGPNMSGKSTYMRQVALITLMAHIGSFVPAKSADIPITDRIFSRIGASDNLAKGESTFMVEMKEVAQILNESTKESLIILDEVGRGTGTFDGLSIAWAVAEYILNHIHAKTLFATHYHELTDLAEKYSEIQNMTITILEEEDNIIFLRKVVEGKTDRSFGIEVAKLAGVKTQVIENAKSILNMLETHNKINLEFDEEPIKQLDFSNYKREYILDRLEKLDMNELSPRSAYELLEALHLEALKLRGE